MSLNDDADGNLHIVFIDGTTVTYDFKHILSHSIEDGCLIVRSQTLRVHYPLTSIKSFTPTYNSPEAAKRIVNAASRERAHMHEVGTGFGEDFNG